MKGWAGRRTLRTRYIALHTGLPRVALYEKDFRPGLISVGVPFRTRIRIVGFKWEQSNSGHLSCGTYTVPFETIFRIMPTFPSGKVT